MLFKKEKRSNGFTVDFIEPLSLDTPLRLFIRRLWLKSSQEGENGQLKKISVFQELLSVGCDYYDLLNLYTDFPLTKSDGEMLVDHAPCPARTYSISASNIRLALPHWTPSKYHTAPITEVVNEIQRGLLSGKQIVKVYNSNLNPKNRRAYNDRYILLITAYKSLIIDINRRTTIQFLKDT